MTPETLNRPQPRGAVVSPAPAVPVIPATPVEPAAAPAEKRRRHRWVLWLVLLVLAGGVGYGIYVLLSRPAAAGPAGRDSNRAVPVVVARVRQGDMPIYLTGLGSVTPISTVTVRSRVDGEIVKVWFEEGQAVQKDAPLIDIDPRPYEAQLGQAKGQLLKDQAALENARAELERDKLAAEALAKQVLETQAALVKQMEGAVAVDNAMVQSADLNVKYAHVTAPIGGRIGLKQVDLGNIVHANDPTGLAVITQLKPITVVFTLPQDEIPRVMKKMNAGEELVVDAFDRDLKNLLATGTLMAVDNQVDPTIGHDPAQGEVRERRGDAVRQPVRQRPVAGGHAGRRGHRPDGGRAARAGLDVRLRRQVRRHGRDADRHDRPDRGRRHVDRDRPGARRARRHRRRRQAPARDESDDRPGKGRGTTRPAGATQPSTRRSTTRPTTRRRDAAGAGAGRGPAAAPETPETAPLPDIAPEAGGLPAPGRARPNAAEGDGTRPAPPQP